MKPHDPSAEGGLSLLKGADAAALPFGCPRLRFVLRSTFLLENFVRFQFLHMFLKRKQVKSCKVFKVQSKDLQKARAMVLHHVASFLASQFLTCPVLLYLLTVGEFHQQCMIYQPPV